MYMYESTCEYRVVIFVQVKDRLSFNLDSLQSGVTVGLQIDNEDRLHLYLNDIKQTVLVERVVGRCHALVELYGQCRQVRIVRSNLNVSRHLEEFPEKARMEEGRRNGAFTLLVIIRNIMHGYLIIFKELKRNATQAVLLPTVNTATSASVSFLVLVYQVLKL